MRAEGPTVLSSLLSAEAEEEEVVEDGPPSQAEKKDEEEEEEEEVGGGCPPPPPATPPPLLEEPGAASSSPPAPLPSTLDLILTMPETRRGRATLPVPPPSSMPNAPCPSRPFAALPQVHTAPRLLSPLGSLLLRFLILSAREGWWGSTPAALPLPPPHHPHLR